MGIYPASLCLEKRLCVVIGAGDVALRKIKSLQDAGARVKVIAPDEREIEGVQHIRRPFRKGDLEGAFLVIAATDNNAVNKAVYQEAEKNNILVNVVDNPPLCTFYVPSVVRRGDFQITIATGGKCPALSKKIRRELEKVYGPEYETYLEVIEEARQSIISSCPESERRPKINQVLNDNDIMRLVKENRLQEARQKVRDRYLT